MASEAANAIGKPLLITFVLGFLYFIVSVAVFEVHPHTGKVLLITALLTFWALFVIVGIRVLTRDLFTLRAAILGFGVSVLMTFFVFWRIGSAWMALHFTVLLVVCPAAILSMGLDNAGRGPALALWLFMIAPANAAVYALAGVALRYVLRKVRP